MQVPSRWSSISLRDQGGGCSNRQLRRDTIDFVQEALGGLNRSRVQSIIIHSQKMRNKMEIADFITILIYLWPGSMYTLEMLQ